MARLGWLILAWLDRLAKPSRAAATLAQALSTEAAAKSQDLKFQIPQAHSSGSCFACPHSGVLRLRCRALGMVRHFGKYGHSLGENPMRIHSRPGRFDDDARETSVTASQMAAAGYIENPPPACCEYLLIPWLILAFSGFSKELDLD
ncbi:hypothetical protein B0H13DRAFT_1902012 [Mycena leptocephala]|nr:hypothetical protein B0H13DRAFT_1902012 [Mycena leptocephala]